MEIGSDVRITSRRILPGFSLWQRIRFLLGLSATSKEERVEKEV